MICGYNNASNRKIDPLSARQRCVPFVTESILSAARRFLQREDPTGFNRVLEQILPRLR